MATFRRGIQLLLKLHWRAAPPGSQAVNTTDAWIQVILERQDHCGNRNHEHDQEGADELSRQPNHICCEQVLQPCGLITQPTQQLYLPDPTTATKPTAHIGF